MISDKMKKLVENNSVIREMFEEGKKLEKKYGKDNVYDFSLGNPSIPAPNRVNEAIKEVLYEEDTKVLHGYMSNSGFEDVREKIASSINKKYGTSFRKDNLVMTVGAASGLNIVLKSILNPNDEVIVLAPYFSEYKNYIENYNGIVIEVKCDSQTFEPDIKKIEESINPNTKAIILNSPNNPTGVIYSKSIIEELSKLLRKKENEYKKTIYLISDEPYRELVYDNNIEVPYVTKYYENTFIIYSFSKSLSIPGERIGYVVVPDEMEDSKTVIEAITISNRILGCVNAPSLIQKVVSKCIDIKVDVLPYKENRDLLYTELKKLNFECVYPQGAFYLFMKTPIEDDKEFCNIAKKYNILVVPASSFGYPGYVRIAYCVSNDMIKRSIPEFKKLAKELGII